MMATITTSVGQIVATATPEGAWTWVNRAAAPPYFADLVDQPELMSKDGGFIDGKCVTEFITLKRGTPRWLADILGRMYNGWSPDLEWHQDED
jgi:hypothetical protein